MKDKDSRQIIMVGIRKETCICSRRPLSSIFSNQNRSTTKEVQHRHLRRAFSITKVLYMLNPVINVMFYVIFVKLDVKNQFAVTSFLR